MIRRIGLAALFYLVPTFALGFVWRLVAFKGYYDALATFDSSFASDDVSVGGANSTLLCGKPYDKALMLVTANRQAIAAIALLAISMTAVVFVVADVMYPGRVTRSAS